MRRLLKPTPGVKTGGLLISTLLNSVLTGHDLNEQFAPGPWVTLRELFVPGFTRVILLPRIFDFGEKMQQVCMKGLGLGYCASVCLPRQLPVERNYWLPLSASLHIALG